MGLKNCWICNKFKDKHPCLSPLSGKEHDFCPGEPTTEEAMSVSFQKSQYTVGYQEGLKKALEIVEEMNIPTMVFSHDIGDRGITDITYRNVSKKDWPGYNQALSEASQKIHQEIEKT